MNKQKLNWYTLGGIIFTIIAGTLLHFTYEWSGRNSIVGFFSPVNESTFEHLKLLFFPMLFYTVFESIKLRREYPRLFIANLLGLLGGLIFIPLVFYIYTAILGTNYLWADITLFVASVILAFLIGRKIAS